MNGRAFLEHEGAHLNHAVSDQIESFQKLDATIFGLSNNDTEYQEEAATRLELSFELLSDNNMDFANALNSPTFVFHEMELIKRVTLVAKDGVIIKVFYPIFPPNENATAVLRWLEENH